MTFGILTLVVLAGLAGPLLAAGRRPLVPVVVGELAAGVVIGVSGFRWLDPAQPTTAFLAQIGFAMLMFAAGMSVPLREPGLVSGLRRGGVTAVAAALLAVPFGIVASRATGAHHAAVYALLLASGSAAILLPALKEHGLMEDRRALTVMAQVAIADIAAIVSLPLVLQPGHALRAALGGLLVAACVLLLYGVTRLLNGRPWVHEVRRWSKKRGWALDLRLSLLVLFGLVWVAQRSGTSALIAGFGVGLMVAAIGGPKRLSRQVAGVATGFMVPLFFVVLGARLDLRALWHHPSLIVLAALLLTTNAFVHVCAALLTRQSLGAGFAATAQLGVPAAVVTLGLEKNVLTSGEGSAIVAAALGSLALTAVGVTLLGRGRIRVEEAPTVESHPEPES
ncbi:MAG TPA: cation:proton antiporter [Gaiellaceae bacterium]|nr:cation:proton antiporter [Gaiellaceae bacterium]